MKDPDVVGEAGQAWKAIFDSDYKQKMLTTNKDWQAGLDLWLLHRPGAHPFWWNYVITGCSLRDIEGVPPAKKHAPDMTHEVSVWACDPEWKPDDSWCTDTEGRWAKYILHPPNMIRQFPAFTDDLLNELLFLVARACCHGHMNPDTDFYRRNVHMLDTTADHLRRGLHPVS